MKVLNVNITLDPVSGGGTAERTFQMSRFLARAGVDCSLLTMDVGLTEQRRRDLADVELVALPVWNRRFYVPRSGLQQVRELVAAADMVHLMGHWNVLNVIVQRLARRLKKPYVVCPAGELPVFGRSRLLKWMFNGAAGRRIVQQADGHIAITQLESNQFAAYCIDPQTVEVIPNGVNPDDFRAADDNQFRSRFGLSQRPFILFMGRLCPIKGPDMLVQAFANILDQLPGYDLVVAGPDGGSADELKRITANCGAQQRIHFVGYLSGDDKSRAYHAADLLVIPSRQEAMSIVVLEAGVAGTPVLITNQCGFDEVAQIGGGQVVPATIDGLQAGLLSLLKDSTKLKSMGEKLRQFVRANYGWDSLVDQYLELYDKLIPLEIPRETTHSGHRSLRVCG